jgi:hypothetical protein
LSVLLGEEYICVIVVTIIHKIFIRNVHMTYPK